MAKSSSSSSSKKKTARTSTRAKRATGASTRSLPTCRWLTPLAADPGYRPETAAMRAVAPMLDGIADGGSTERLCEHLLGLARRAG